MTVNYHTVEIVPVHCVHVLVHLLLCNNPGMLLVPVLRLPFRQRLGVQVAQFMQAPAVLWAEHAAASVGRMLAHASIGSRHAPPQRSVAARMLAAEHESVAAEVLQAHPAVAHAQPLYAQVQALPAFAHPALVRWHALSHSGAVQLSMADKQSCKRVLAAAAHEPTATCLELIFTSHFNRSGDSGADLSQWRHAAGISAQIAQCVHVTSITVRTSDGYDHYIPKAKRQQRLSYQACQIGALCRLLPKLQSMSLLQTLDCTLAQFDVAAAVSLAQVLQHCRGLTTLAARSCNWHMLAAAVAAKLQHALDPTSHAQLRTLHICATWDAAAHEAADLQHDVLSQPCWSHLQALHLHAPAASQCGQHVLAGPYSTQVQALERRCKSSSS